MNFISETIIEQKLINLLREFDYTFLSKEEVMIMRSSNTSYVLLDEVIKKYLFNNYSKKITEGKANKIISKLRDLTGSSALISNIEFLMILVQGIRIQDESTNETETYRLIQEKDISKNLFHVTNQFICDSMEDGKKTYLLKGENKCLYFTNKPLEVFSTGFFNFSIKYVDFISFFISSDSFREQKTNQSTGTTMQGITQENFLNLKTKLPSDFINSSILSEVLVSLSALEARVKNIIISSLKLLV